jgi:pantetheine-phosphate adenylyltransferase
MHSVIAVYPGSFDPVTNGHLDLIERGSKIFSRLFVAVLRNQDKDPMFEIEERLEMLRQTTSAWPNVEVDSFHGLLADYARRKEARFMLPAEAYSFLSSRLVREVARLGGSLRGLVPPSVEERLKNKFG